MIFSSSDIEKAGNDAYLNGLQFNRNPYLTCEGFINDIKRRLWSYGWKKAEKDCRGA